MTDVLSRGDFIINPKTSRAIKIGGGTYMALVREGLINGIFNDEKKLAEQPNDYDETEKIIYKANKTLKEQGKQAVRGRGIYKGSIVSKKSKASVEEVQKHTAKCATKVMKNYATNSELDDKELEKELERLILQEIANTSVVPTKKNNVKKSIKSKQVEEQYETVEHYDEDEGDDDEDELDDDDDNFYK